MLPVFFFILALVTALIYFFLKGGNFVDQLLASILFFNVGIMGIMGAYAHTFMADQTAALIGWEGGSPFQFEVAMANLAFGALGITALWFRRTFWLAVVIGFSTFSLGAFVGHLVQFAKGNNAPYNIGIFVWAQDLLLPILLIYLLYLHFSREHRY